MQRRVTLFALGFLLTVLAPLAWGSVTVEFPSATDRLVWTADDPSSSPPASAAVKSASVALDTPGAYVIALDPQTNRLASTKVADLKGPWKPAESDYKLIGKIVFRLRHDGKPVAAASASLKSAGKSVSGMIAPGDGGNWTIYGIAPGPAELQVSYRSAGASKRLSPVPTYNLQLGTAPGDMVIEVPIVDSVDVIEPAQPATKTATTTAPAAKPEPKTEVPFWRRLIVMVIGFGISGAVIYGLIRAIQANHAKIDSHLSQLGVQIPKDPLKPDDDGTPPPVAATPEPMQQIVLDPVAPTFDTGFDAPPAGVAAVANPRLVGGAGGIHLIPDGESVIGRDAACTIAVTTETTLSRQHAKFVRTGDQVTLVDLGSTNGTFVNQVKNDGSPVNLRPGDAVQFGAAIYRYEN